MNCFSSTSVGVMIHLAQKTEDKGERTVQVHLNDKTDRIFNQLMLLENQNTDFFWKRPTSRDIAIE